MGGVKPLLAQLAHTPEAKPCCWLMRQAGRYLPEYRALRAQAGDFMRLALNPRLATEVTLHPLRRFGVDGAILFSDILMVPYGLGVGLEFATGEGPLLTPIETMEDVQRLYKTMPSLVNGRITPVFETLERLRPEVGEAALIGFAGAPWTVVTYMVEGGSSRDFTKTRTMMREKPVVFSALMAVVEEATVLYVDAQIKAGAEVVQLFDSWAGALVEEADFEAWCMQPLYRIAQALRLKHPQVPLITFPKGISEAFMMRLVTHTQGLFQGLGVGYDRKMTDVRQGFEGQLLCLQGNYSPERLATLSADQVYQEVKEMTASMQGWSGGYIANLGHGVVPATPVENVAAFVRAAQGG